MEASRAAVAILERRSVARRVPQPGEPLARMRVRTGPQLEVVDVSRGGALVEGSARLLPGTHADVHVTTTEGRSLVRSRVVRAVVWEVRPDVIRYRTGLAFDRPVPADEG
jgi:hypothetical protein